MVSDDKRKVYGLVRNLTVSVEFSIDSTGMVGDCPTFVGNTLIVGLLFAD